MNSTIPLSLITRTHEPLYVQLLTSLPSLEHAILAASEGFGQPIDPALSQDVEHHLNVCHFGFEFLTQDGVIAGFTLFKSYDDLLCGGGMMIRPAFQQAGLVREGIKLAQDMTQARYFAYRTQSPRMWSAGRKVTRVWSPLPETGFTNPELNDARLRASNLLGVTTTVTRAVFDRPLYDQKPTHKNPTIQAWWDSICNFESGDMVLCVGAF